MPFLLGIFPVIVEILVNLIIMSMYSVRSHGEIPMAVMNLKRILLVCSGFFFYSSVDTTLVNGTDI